MLTEAAYTKLNTKAKRLLTRYHWRDLFAAEDSNYVVGESLVDSESLEEAEYKIKTLCYHLPNIEYMDEYKDDLNGKLDDNIELKIMSTGLEYLRAKYFDDIKIKDIARKFGVSTRTVNYKIKKELNILRRRMSK